MEHNTSTSASVPNTKRYIYLDQSSSVKPDPRVVEAMQDYLAEHFGNPAAVHYFGDAPTDALNEGRETLARFIGADTPEEIYYTSGATESNNWAIQGFARRHRAKGKHIVTSKVEHPSVQNPIKYMVKQGFEMTEVDVDPECVLDTDQFQDSLRDDTILVSIMYANNEVGTIEPIREIGEILKDRKMTLFHVDAVAAEATVPLNVEEEKIDLLTLSSNDMYGPRGIGALYIRKGVHIDPIIHGGPQEHGSRAGTENVPGIVGFSKAANILKNEQEEETQRIRGLRDYVVDEILNRIERSYLCGHPTNRTAGMANMRFSFIEGEALLLMLNTLRICSSSSSACTSRSLTASHVLEAMGIPHDDAQSALMVNLGRYNTKDEVEYFLDKLPGVIHRLREISPMNRRAS